MPGKGTIPRVCRQCGVTFFTFPCRVREKGAYYCSQRCAFAGRASPALARFWAKVERTDSCWLWTAGHDKDGYGLFTDAPTHQVRAHRYSWELVNGPIPPGMVICHRCDTPACVNPDHMFLGSNLDNVRDAIAKRRMNTLTPDDVRAIRRDYVPSVIGYRQLATRFGVDPSMVRWIIKGKAWKWLED